MDFHVGQVVNIWWGTPAVVERWDDVFVWVTRRGLKDQTLKLWHHEVQEPV
jgi:hypothetical protein